MLVGKTPSFWNLARWRVTKVSSPDPHFGRVHFWLKDYGPTPYSAKDWDTLLRELSHLFGPDAEFIKHKISEKDQSIPEQKVWCGISYRSLFTGSQRAVSRYRLWLALMYFGYLTQFPTTSCFGVDPFPEHMLRKPRTSSLIENCYSASYSTTFSGIQSIVQRIPIPTSRAVTPLSKLGVKIGYRASDLLLLLNREVSFQTSIEHMESYS